MEIKIKLFGIVYSFCFGHETPWFRQLSFITVIKEYYVNNEVEYATLIWRS